MRRLSRINGFSLILIYLCMDMIPQSLHQKAPLWNRLENLLVQYQKDQDFSAKEALQPVLKLLLGPDEEELRVLVIKEALSVSEAIAFGAALDAYNSVLDFVKPIISNA